MRVITQQMIIKYADDPEQTRISLEVPMLSPPEPILLIQDTLVAECIGLCALQYLQQFQQKGAAVDIGVRWEQITHSVGSSVIRVYVALPAVIPVAEHCTILRHMQRQLRACQQMIDNHSEVIVLADPA